MLLASLRCYTSIYDGFIYIVGKCQLGKLGIIIVIIVLNKNFLSPPRGSSDVKFDGVVWYERK